MRPAIAERLPWSTFALEEVPCGFDPGPALLSLEEDGGVPLLPFLHARTPKLWQPRLAVFRPTWIRADELAGWVFVVDGASLQPLCQAPLEARKSDEGSLRAAFDDAVATTRERLRVGVTAPDP
jgi:hypothetical protein